MSDPTKSVGDYARPNWVGAEFQSTTYDAFSVTVMWEQTDGDLQLHLLNQTSVKGYEVGIYKMESEKSELQKCFCVTDPRMRNVSNIRNVDFIYKEMSHMIVEVRGFPSLINKGESNTRRNCSLLGECATVTEDCLVDCYSWPQSCLSFELPSYDPQTCAPPLWPTYKCQSSDELVK